MRHHNRNRKFGRTASGRRALLRSLAHALIEHETITTTEAKAKELRPYIERLLTHAIKGTLASRRLIVSRLGGHKDAAKRLSEVIAPTFTERAGGYTRITKVGQRSGDAAKMAVIEFVK